MSKTPDPKPALDRDGAVDALRQEWAVRFDSHDVERVVDVVIAGALGFPWQPKVHVEPPVADGFTPPPS